MTDARPRHTPPRVNLSAREWKLFVIGGLGLAYAASLSVVAAQARPGAPPAADAAARQHIGTATTVVSPGPAAATRAPRILTRTS